MGRKFSQEDFINKAKIIHNNKYDYSKTIYKNKRTNVIIICPEHGEFSQNPEVHLRGSGCKECGKSISKSKRFKDFDIVLEEFKKVHGNKYDYSKVKYNGTDSRVEIICPEHGSFFQTPYEHKKGSGCPYCFGLYKTNEDFISSAKKVHGDKYDYSKVNFLNVRDKVEIICKEHGSFFQNYINHVTNKCGCPKCNSNWKGEKAIRNFLQKNKIIFDEQYTFDDLKDKKHLRFDFFIKEKNLCIEYDGLQHFEPIFGKESFKETTEHDIKKNKYCKEKKINLLRIKYSDFYNIDGILSEYFDISKNYKKEVDDIFNSIGGFPYCEYKKSVLLNDWYKLSNFNYKDRAGIGNYIIKHFHKNIYTSNVFGKPSPVEAWSNKSIMKRTIKNRLLYSKPPITPEKIKQGLNVTKLAPKVSVFNPNLAKRIASTYLKEFNLVFDPFSGFSGRMLGVCASNKKYIGQDINKESINASNEIINLLSLNASVIEKDIFNSKGEYECLFTCPPYNLKEIWSQDIKNLSCDEWINICLDNFKCKKYIFVVDNTILFKDNIIEELNNKSHFSSNKEYIILIEGKDE